MSDKAVLEYKGERLELDTIVGSENEVGIDITSLRPKTGMITLDPGFANTGSCTSDITFINGEKGILQYRGYPIEELAEHSSFMETAYLVIYGELPGEKELADFHEQIERESRLHYGMKSHFEGFPDNAPPMAVLSAMLNILACYHTDLLTTATEGEAFTLPASRIISKVRAIAAWAYRTSIGRPFMPPRGDLSYAGNFLHMMFSQTFQLYDVPPEVDKALDLFLILHADHEQNCSTSTVRMVGSSHASLFSAVSAGVGALWGPRHGGANAEVIKMLTRIHDEGISPKKFVERAEDPNSPEKLMGFGHRVYKSFDPRATILKGQVDNVLKALGISDPLRTRGDGALGRLFHRTKPVSQRGFLQRHPPAGHRHPHRYVHRAVRHRPHARLDRQLAGNAPAEPAYQPSPAGVHRGNQAGLQARQRPIVPLTGLAGESESGYSPVFATGRSLSLIH